MCEGYWRSWTAKDSTAILPCVLYTMEPAYVVFSLTIISGSSGTANAGTKMVISRPIRRAWTCSARRCGSVSGGSDQTPLRICWMITRNVGMVRIVSTATAVQISTNQYIFVDLHITIV